MNQKKILLPPSLLKILKWLHISCASILFGALVSMVYLFLMKDFASIGAREDYFIYILFDSIVTYSFFALIVTAFIYGIFSKWGFFIHYWILLKWILTLTLFTLIWLGWASSINGMVALTDGKYKVTSGFQEYLTIHQNAFVFTLLALILVWIIFLISSLKPWAVRKPKYVMKESLRITISTFILLIIIIMIIGSSIGLSYYRNIPIQNSDLSQLSEGHYEGRFKMGGFTYILMVEIGNNRIRDIKMVNNRESSYSRHAEAVLFRIIEHQNANVAAITGATTSSKVLMKAVENALK